MVNGLSIGTRGHGALYDENEFIGLSLDSLLVVFFRTETVKRVDRFVVAGLQEVYPHGRCESRFVPGECFGSGGGTSDPFVRDGGGYSETG